MKILAHNKVAALKLATILLGLLVNNTIEWL